MLKELYVVIKHFCKFTACIKSRAINGFYRAFWEVLPAIQLLVSEYKNFTTHYTAFTLS